MTNGNPFGRFCFGLFVWAAVLGVCSQPRAVSAACACGNFAWQLTGGVASNPGWTVFNADGQVFRTHSHLAPTQVVCDNGAGSAPLVFPMAVKYWNGSSYQPWVTISQGDASACVTNSSSDLKSNYVHCLTWTNNTGVAKVGVVMDSFGGTGGIVRVSAGGIFSQCFTNDSPESYEFCYRPWEGASLDEYVCNDTFNTNWGFTTSGSSVSGSSSNHTASQAFTNGIVTIGPSNQVTFWSPTPSGFTNFGSASQADIRALGDALIRALGGPLGEISRATGQSAQSATNGGGGNMQGVIDAVNDARNSITNTVGSVGSQAHSDATNLLSAVTNLQAAAWGTNGMSTNSFGSAWESGGAALAGSANAGWLGSATNAAGWSGSNSPSGSESALQFTLPVGGEVLDLRPSSWESDQSALYAVVKLAGSVFVLWMLYSACWEIFQKAFDTLNVATAGVGKGLTSGTLVGGTAGQAVRVTVASVLTVGIAGLPALLFSFLAATGATDGVSMSILTLIQTTAGGISTPVGSAVGTVWVWFDRMVPWVALVTSIANYYAFRVSSLAFTSLWMTIYRILPAVVLLFAVSELSAATVIVDNRLHVAVGILTTDGLEWYPPGERTTVLPDDWYVTSSQGTNGMQFFASDSELTRFVVFESTTNSIAGYTYGEGGFKTGFGRGLVVTWGLGALWVVVVFAKRMLKAGGIYSE